MRCLALAMFAAAALALGEGACDPVHDQAVDALGPEAPGVPKGPTHRPGQPCVTCHDGALGDPPHFTVAGTVFVNATDKAGAVGATVTLTSADDTTYTATTNSVGNFYVEPKDFTPTYPMKVVVEYEHITVKMTSHVGRDGSCADCHTNPAGPTSAGQVYIPTDGVTP